MAGDCRNPAVLCVDMHALELERSTAGLTSSPGVIKKEAAMQDNSCFKCQKKWLYNTNLETEGGLECGVKIILSDCTLCIEVCSIDRGEHPGSSQSLQFAHPTVTCNMRAAVVSACVFIVWWKHKLLTLTLTLDLNMSDDLLLWISGQLFSNQSSLHLECMVSRSSVCMQNTNEEVIEVIFKM